MFSTYWYLLSDLPQVLRDNRATHPLNEEVSVGPGDKAKVCVLEYVVHNPHDVVEELSAGVEGRHDEWHV